MKTLKHLLTALLLMVATVAMAYDFEVDGIYYNIVSEATVSVSGKNSSVAGEVVIPDKVVYNGVTYIIRSIAQNAFSRRTEMTSVIVGDSVKTIAANAFYNCSGLKEVTIGHSVSKIDIYSFTGCTGILKVTFNNKNISHGFSNKTSIKEVVISDNTVTIGDGAFYMCTGLEELVIGNNVVSIGEQAFRYCSGLTKIKIPNSVTEIEGSAFSDCTGIGEFTIPDSVVRIGDLAFYGCTNLKKVRIGNGVKTLGDAVFQKCSNLSSVQLGKNTETIGKSAFAYCSSLKEIIIPKSVTTIGDEAFSDCSALHKVIIEDGNTILSLGYVPSANKGLFGYARLDTVYLGRNLNYNDEYTPFAVQKNLKSVEIGDSVTVISSGAFKECIISSIMIPNSVISILDNAFYKCSFNDINIGNSVADVGDYAFYQCSGIDKISIGFGDSGTGLVGKYAFSYCPDLEEVVIEKSLTGIDKYAFYACSSLEKLKIGDGVKAIEDNAFGYCTDLKEVTFGKRVNYIGNSAFVGCDNIETIYALPSRAINCGEQVFSDNAYKYATLYVKENSIGSYETTEPWSKFYIETVRDFTLTYVVDGVVYKTETLEYGTAIEPLAEPTKRGYTFSGWSDIPATMPAEDITITGSFTVNTYAVTYIVDGEVYAIDSIAYGCEIVLRDEPVKEGHTFSGWSEIPATMSDEDITITGSFTVNTYVVTYIVDGTVYVTDSVVYGAEIVPRDEPTREGHTFSGWSEIPPTMPAANITIMGSFAVNNYTVTFMIDGEVYETMSVEFGAEIELPTPPEKEGHTFSGWLGVPDTMPAEDIVIEGKFIADDTGINDVKNESSNVRTVYDLQGRKVDNPTNGIYIVNGKKVFVK